MYNNGRFAVSSSPSQFAREGTLDFIIKLSDFPMTKWIHQEAQIGDVRSPVLPIFSFPSVCLRVSVLLRSGVVSVPRQELA